jgi:hypothetical protein
VLRVFLAEVHHISNLTSGIPSVKEAHRKVVGQFPITRRNIKRRPFWSRVGCLPQSLQKGTPSMDSKKYIGMDVHKESISIAVMNGSFFLASLQKLLHVCASVIWRPSLVAFFLRNSICCRRYLCS